MSIPRHIHQIWIGPKKRPDAWLQTWRNRHPTFAYTLWTETSLAAFPMMNREAYTRYLSRQDFAGAADVARVEILYQLGGIYIDADSICRHTLDGAPFLDAPCGFFAAYEYDRRIANGVIGATQWHPILKLYRERIKETTVFEPACYTVGGTMLTTCVDLSGGAEILAPHTFYPKLGHYHEAPGTIYARQMWGSTKGLYEDA